MDVKRHYYVTTGNDYNGKYKCELNQIIIMKNNHPSLNTSCSDDGAKELIEVMNEWRIKDSRVEDDDELLQIFPQYHLWIQSVRQEQPWRTTTKWYYHQSVDIFLVSNFN